MISLGCMFHFALAVVFVSGGFLFAPRFAISPYLGALAGAIGYVLCAIIHVLIRTGMEKVSGFDKKPTE